MNYILGNVEDRKKVVENMSQKKAIEVDDSRPEQLSSLHRSDVSSNINPPDRVSFMLQVEREARIASEKSAAERKARSVESREERRARRASTRDIRRASKLLKYVPSDDVVVEQEIREEEHLMKDSMKTTSIYLVDGAHISRDSVNLTSIASEFSNTLERKYFASNIKLVRL